MDDFEALLLAQEERFDKHKLAQDPLLQINTVSAPWRVKTQNRRKFSTYTPRGGRSYTLPDSCPFACPSSYQPSYWHSVKQFCQICHKSGHTTDVYWHRYDPPPTTSFNANVSQHALIFDNDSTPSILGAPSTIEDPLWYPGTGATHHVTKTPRSSHTNNPITVMTISSWVMVKVRIFYVLGMLPTLFLAHTLFSHFIIYYMFQLLQKISLVLLNFPKTIMFTLNFFLTFAALNIR